MSLARGARGYGEHPKEAGAEVLFVFLLPEGGGLGLRLSRKAFQSQGAPVGLRRATAVWHGPADSPPSGAPIPLGLQGYGLGSNLQGKLAEPKSPILAKLDGWHLPSFSHIFDRIGMQSEDLRCLADVQ